MREPWPAPHFGQHLFSVAQFHVLSQTRSRVAAHSASPRAYGKATLAGHNASRDIAIIVCDIDRYADVVQALVDVDTRFGDSGRTGGWTTWWRLL